MADLIASIGGSLAQVLVGHPFDTIKTRIQSSKSINILTLHRGITFPLLSTSLINSVMFGSYGYFTTLTKNDFVSGFASGLVISPIVAPIDKLKIDFQINSKIDELIDETSKLSAGSLLPSLNNTQNFLSEKISKVTETINDAVSITDRLDNLKADVEAQSKLACVFNKIKGDLARLIGAGVRRSLARKQNQTPQNLNQVRPT